MLTVTVDVDGVLARNDLLCVTVQASTSMPLDSLIYLPSLLVSLNTAHVIWTLQFVSSISPSTARSALTAHHTQPVAEIGASVLSLFINPYALSELPYVSNMPWQL